MNYFQYNGLIQQRDQTSENLNTFLATYVNLGGKIDREYFISGMHDRQQPNGLYLRSPIHTERTMSNDEITAYMVLSQKLGTNHRFWIWNQLKDNYGAYPVVVHNWTDRLPYNPGNGYAWASFVKSKWSFIFAPLYAVNLLISTLKPATDTSTKIQHWLILSNIDSPIFKWFFEKRMTAMYGEKWLASLLLYYHRDESEDFPVFKQLKEYYAVK